MSYQLARSPRTVRRHCRATSDERGRHYRVGLRPALRLALWSSHKRDEVAEVVAGLSTGVTNSGPSSRIDSYHPNETSQVGPRDERLASVGRPVDVPLSDSRRPAIVGCAGWVDMSCTAWTPASLPRGQGPWNQHEFAGGDIRPPNPLAPSLSNSRRGPLPVGVNPAAAADGGCRSTGCIRWGDRLGRLGRSCCMSPDPSEA
jgi:hypothetical protein